MEVLALEAQVNAVNAAESPISYMTRKRLRLIRQGNVKSGKD